MNGSRQLSRALSVACLALLWPWVGLEAQFHRKQRIAVKADAAADYVERRSQDPSAPETYVVSQGKYFDGVSRDGSISEDSFGDVVENLGKDLAKRGYLPAADMQSADLLIVVHWGSTTVQEDSMLDESIMDTYNVSPSSDDFNGYELQFAQMMDETNRMSRAAEVGRNARLLGYDEDLRKEGRELMPSEREHALLQQLDSPRYFVILMAWDAQALLAEKQRKLLWSTRMSVRSTGTNFRKALPLLSIAASDVFGTATEGLSTKTFRRNEYKAVMGELEMVEMSEEDKALTREADEEQ